jgi:hypothetical protein
MKGTKAKALSLGSLRSLGMTILGQAKSSVVGHRSSVFDRWQIKNREQS